MPLILYEPRHDSPWDTVISTQTLSQTNLCSYSSSAVSHLQTLAKPFTSPSHGGNSGTHFNRLFGIINEIVNLKCSAQCLSHSKH